MNLADWINRRTAPAPHRGWLAIALPVGAATAVFVAFMLHARLLFQIWPPCGDLDLRLNEIHCVLSGVDPYAVFERRMESDQWRPFDLPDDPDHPRGRVNGYAPWEYTFLMPLAPLPKAIVFRFWIGLSFAAVLLLWFLSVRIAMRRLPHGRTDLALWVGVIALGTTKATPTCILCGNFGVFLPLFALGMAWALDRRRDALAGVFLALLMVKPQMGLLFFLPPLYRGRWRTIVSAGTILFSATIPPALLCHESPVRLLLGLANHGDALSRATGFVPPGLFARLQPMLGASGVLVASALAGIAFCSAALRLLRHGTDWLVLLSPPAFFATLWTYSLGHDRCLDSIPLLLAGIALFRARSRKGRLLPASFIIATVSAGFLLWQSIPPFYPMHRFRPSDILGRIGVPFAASVPDLPASVLLAVSIPLLVLKIALAFALWRRAPSDGPRDEAPAPRLP